jgi:uncharacterized protein
LLEERDMPNQQDRDAINGLFDRIDDVARRSAPRDPDAEALIQQRLQHYPPAPYYMAQTILVQEEALRKAQERIEQLESQTQGSGGFLGGLFGGAGGTGGQPQQQAPARRGPWGNPGDGYDDRRGSRIGGGGGGFLAGAAQTALGVTGGVLLGSAIAGMFAGDAQADEYDPGADQGAEDTGSEDADFGGGDFGGDDFDTGGEF